MWNRPVLALLMLLAPLGASCTTRQLRYSFKKGETFQLVVRSTRDIRWVAVPEDLRRVLGEAPTMQIRTEGVLDGRVVGITESGDAELEATWVTARALGTVRGKSIDYQWTQGDDKREGRPQVSLPPELESLAYSVRHPAPLRVDARGNATPPSGRGGIQELGGFYQAFNALVGPMPLDAVGVGTEWTQVVGWGPGFGISGGTDLGMRMTQVVEAVGTDGVVIRSKGVLVPPALEEAGKHGFSLKHLSGTSEGWMVFDPRAGVPRNSTFKAELLGSVEIAGGMNGPWRVGMVIKLDYEQEIAEGLGPSRP